MKKNIIKYSIISVILILIAVLLFFIYKNLFSSSESSRYKDIEKYVLTNDEMNSVKDKINELQGINSIDIYINSKIIKIVVKLNEEISFEDIKNKANEAITNFSEDNLAYYDVQIFISSSNEDSDVYPQIGYKFKANSEFSW